MPKQGAHHRFAERLPRSRMDAAAVCPECLSPLSTHDGQPYPRNFRFPARKVAKALVKVAGGGSYRNAGETVRADTGRVIRKKIGGQPAGPRVVPANLVADWVEAFADPLWEALGPREWPPVVVVDEMLVHGLSKRARKARNLPWPQSLGPRAKPKKGGQRLYSVLVAEGYEGRHDHQPWAAWACPSGDEPEWVRFFESLPGAPAVMVGDAAKAWQNAAKTVWPGPATPELVVSEYHLARMLAGHLNRLRVPDPDPLRDLCLRAFEGIVEWTAAMTALDMLAFQASDDKLDRWIRTWSSRISKQISRHPIRSIVHSTGEVEKTIKRVERKIYGRRSLYRNQARLNRLLRLVLLNLRDESTHRWDDDRVWATTIREWLDRHGRTPSLRAINDHGAPSLRYVPPPPGGSKKHARLGTLP